MQIYLKQKKERVLRLNSYKVEIIDASKELTGKERMTLKDLSNVVNLDRVRVSKPVTISVDYYAVLRVYTVKVGRGRGILYVLIDKGGTMYTTRCTAFWNSFKNYWKDMKNSNAECKLIIYEL